MFTFAFQVPFFSLQKKRGLLFFIFLASLQYPISFQVQSPISYLGNTFSTSVKFIFVTLLVSPGEPGRRKGSHYSLVLQPGCLHLHSQEKSTECRQLSLIFHHDAVFSGDSICVVNILKGSLGSPLPFFCHYLFIYLFFLFF